VTFDYWDESDGVNYATGQGVPFYPIPSQAITQPHWIEGGAPGSVDERSSADRHLFVIDCTNRHLYELYNVWHDGTKWRAGSGAFFDMKTNDRRPDTWTSADAAGLAIFPGLVRYDEAWNPVVSNIGHAFRVTVRATNGYVYPASHRAGGTAGALPMGARLRLKKSVNGADPALRTGDANVQKIFRAMQTHGLIVADNGSDMYVTGTFDTRWNNSILNPAFALLSAGDFEVVQLGWKPTVAAPALASITASPSAVVAGNGASGYVTLTTNAPAPVAVSLSSASAAVSVPASVNVPAGSAGASFPIVTSAVAAQTVTSMSASYGGVTRTATFTVNPAPPLVLAALALGLSSSGDAGSYTGTVYVTAPAPAGGVTIVLASSSTVASVPATVVIAQGETAAQFAIVRGSTARGVSVTITATYGGVTKAAKLRVQKG